MSQSKGGNSRKSSSKGAEWNSNLEKYVIKWWLDQLIIDMMDDGAWEALKADLYKYASIGINVSSLQLKWINTIDPQLDSMFHGSILIRDRTEYRFADTLSLPDKMKIMTARLKNIKEQLQERNMDLPFQVEPRLKQSVIKFSPNTSLISPSVKASCTTPTSSVPNLSVRRLHSLDSYPDSTESHKRHKLGYDPVLPMEFVSQDEGAKSVDVQGCVLPKQIFEGKTFFLLQDTTGYVGKANFNSQMYLVEVHGGRVIEKMRDIQKDTLFIAPEGGVFTEIVWKNRKIYKPSLIIEHVDNLSLLSQESMKKHLCWDLHLESSRVVLKLENVKKENECDKELVDLVSDDEDQAQAISPNAENMKKDGNTVEEPKGSNDANQEKRNEIVVLMKSNNESRKKEGVGSNETSTPIPEAPDHVAEKGTNVSHPIQDNGQQQSVPVGVLKDTSSSLATLTDTAAAESQILQKERESPSTKDTCSQITEQPTEEAGPLIDNQTPRLWTVEEKRFTNSLVFRYSLDGTSALQICRRASKQFENERAAYMSPETIRTRLRRILSKTGAYKNEFDGLKDEFGLNKEMLVAFEKHFKETLPPLSNSGGTGKANDLKGIALIDEFAGVTTEND